MSVGGVSDAQSLKLSGLADIFLNLNIGDAVRAQVLDIFTNEVLLKLFDGSTHKAAFMSRLDAKRGDILEFKVINKNDGQLFLETVKNTVKNGVDSEAVQNKLVSLNIKPTARNMEIAREIVTAGLELDMEILGEITDAVDTYRTLKLKEAVFLKANNIVTNKENINTLRQIADRDFKIGSELGKLIVQLEADENISVNKPENIITVSGLRTQENHDTQSIVEPPSSRYPTEALISNLLDNVTDSDLEILFKEAELPQKLAAFLKKEGGDIPPLNFPVKTQAPEGAVVQHKLSQQLQEKIMEFPEAEFDAFGKLPFAVREKLELFLNNLIIKLKAAGSDDGKINVIDITAVEKSEEQPVVSNGPAGPKLEKPFTNIKDELFVSTAAHDKETAQSIMKNIRDLKDVLDVIRNYSVQSGLNNSSEVSVTVDGIQSRISFMNSISNQFLYYQIPLNMKGYDTTGELYVMKRRDTGRKKSVGDNITFFISLDTMNMGYIGSLIEISKKNISINMKLENKEVIEYFKDNRKILYKSLIEKGYRLVDVNYKLPDEKENILNIVEIHRKETRRKTASFDLRV